MSYVVKLLDLFMRSLAQSLGLLVGVLIALFMLISIYPEMMVSIYRGVLSAVLLAREISRAMLEILQ